MVSRNALRLTLATLTLLAARSVSAGPISFTGDAEKDFNPTADQSIKVIQIDPDPLNRIIQLPQMTSQGIINGYAIKDIRLQYDEKTDVLSVGMNSYSIAGSAIGNGGAEMAKALTASGGVDPAHLGGSKSITMAFAGTDLNNTKQAGTPVFVAGVPADKSSAGPGIDGFNVAQYKASTAGIQSSYGATMTQHLGTLAFDPSPNHPDFEFTIKNFSKISPNVIDPKSGFWIQAFAGSPNDNPIGEEFTSFIRVPAFQPETIPEPTTWLAWSVALTAAGAVRLGRRSKA
jgi:hypothetical protein